MFSLRRIQKRLQKLTSSMPRQLHSPTSFELPGGTSTDHAEWLQELGKFGLDRFSDKENSDDRQLQRVARLVSADRNATLDGVPGQPRVPSCAQRGPGLGTVTVYHNLDRFLSAFSSSVAYGFLSRIFPLTCVGWLHVQAKPCHSTF